jgi:hypothetical protein
MVAREVSRCLAAARDRQLNDSNQLLSRQRAKPAASSHRATGTADEMATAK